MSMSEEHGKKEWPRLEDLDPRVQEAFEATYERHKEVLHRLAEM